MTVLLESWEPTKTLSITINTITNPLYQFKTIVVAQCAKTDGPTDAPITTVAPCNDKWSNCPALAEEKCYKGWVGEECPKSCGKCPGEKIEVFEETVKL